MGHVGKEIRLHRKGGLSVVQSRDKLMFHLLARRDDARGAEQTVAAVVQPLKGSFDPDFRAILVEHAKLRMARSGAWRHRLEDIANHRRIIRMRVTEPGHRQNLCRREPECALN